MAIYPDVLALMDAGVGSLLFDYSMVAKNNAGFLKSPLPWLPEANFVTSSE
jgi:hypothetical protein